MDSMLRLFKALPIDIDDQKINSGLMERTIRSGFVFDPKVMGNYSVVELDLLTESVASILTLTAAQMNASFHKSWEKVSNASIEQLFIEQIIHYITTYGFERMGVYHEDSVYIPNEELDIPEIKDEKIGLIVIRGMTREEIKARLLDLLQSGIALAEDTIRDVIDVATYVGLDEKEINSIKNREARVMLYDYLDKIPSNPTEFLRFLIYKATNKTLIIKNKDTIESIKSKDGLYALNLFRKYGSSYGLERIAEIFYRFKPIILAFRSNTELKKIINKIRRLARTHHKPMPVDYLNSLTSKIERGDGIDEGELAAELDRVNTFRKIRLAYALKFRTKDVDSIMYRIRNGRAYAREFEFANKKAADYILEIVLRSIANDVSKHVSGKKVYIPDNIEYALPATEKQFTGNFPSGTCVTVPRDMIVGINWKNVKGRVDLDLSLVGTEKYGWDAYYRSGDRSIMFSGDLTDAPGKNGATESFYVKKQDNNELIMMVNYFNYDSSKSIPIKIMVAQEKADNLEHNYTVDPNNVIAIAPSKIGVKQMILGVLVPCGDCCKFYFAETAIGKSITSRMTDYVKHSRNYLASYYRSTIGLRGILNMAGAEFVDDVGDADFDLSPASISKDTILNMVQ